MALDEVVEFGVGEAEVGEILRREGDIGDYFEQELGGEGVE